MIYLALLSLLGTGLAALAVDTFMDSDDQSTDPNDELIVNGTNQPDILEAARGQTVNGYAGDDQIEVTGANASVNGGAGDDSIVSSGYLDVTLDGGGGDDYIDYIPFGSHGADQGSVQGGPGNDTIDARGEGGATLNGGPGNDYINAQGAFISVSGGDSDDTIIGNTSEDDRGSYLYGNAGDDLIVLKDTPAYERGSLADGGAGNDTISTLTYLGGNETDDILTGGEGADRFELDFGYDFHIDNYD